MAMLLVMLAFLIAGLCLAKNKVGCRRFLGGVLALLYLPVGTLVNLIRRCK